MEFGSCVTWNLSPSPPGYREGGSGPLVPEGEGDENKLFLIFVFVLLFYTYVRSGLDLTFYLSRARRSLESL